MAGRQFPNGVSPVRDKTPEASALPLVRISNGVNKGKWKMGKKGNLFQVLKKLKNFSIFLLSHFSFVTLNKLLEIRNWKLEIFSLVIHY